MKKIYIYIFFLFTSCNYLFADEILAIVAVDSIKYDYKNNFLYFDLHVKNNAKLEPWDRWANGTFQLWFHDSSFSRNDIDAIEFLVTESELDNLGNGKPSYDQDLMYDVTPRIFQDRISITVRGPKRADSCHYLPFNSSVRIGRFVIKFKPSIKLIPRELHFKEGPDSAHKWYYYQALAYKQSEDDIKPIDDKFYKFEDNVEMDNGQTRLVDYRIIMPEIPKMQFIDFWAEYAGNYNVTLHFSTLTQPFHKGFILDRFLMPFGENIPESAIPFDAPVGHWDVSQRIHGEVDDTLVFNPMHMWDSTGYAYRHDVVPQREETYFYRLRYTDENDSIQFLAICHLQIPQVIIYDAFLSDNPFGDWVENKTTVIFRLEEEAYVTIKVYDLEGRLVSTLKDNVKMSQGWHGKDDGDNDLVFRAAANAQQGLYNIIISAVPTVPMPIDIGNTVLKVQFVR